MAQVCRNIGAVLMIAAIVLYLTIPAFHSTREPYHLKRDVESMRAAVAVELRTRNRDGLLYCLASALAGAGVALIVVGYAGRKAFPASATLGRDPGNRPNSGTS